jgi:hypothetical protein
MPQSELAGGELNQSPLYVVIWDWWKSMMRFFWKVSDED